MDFKLSFGLKTNKMRISTFTSAEKINLFTTNFKPHLFIVDFLVRFVALSFLRGSFTYNVGVVSTSQVYRGISGLGQFSAFVSAST